MSGTGDVLQLIRDRGALTRGDVLELTGLSRMTVAGRIDTLLDAGLIVEQGATRTTGGRPSRRLTFNPAHATVITASIDTTHTTIALTDLSGTVHGRERLDVRVLDGPQRTLDAIAQSARTLSDRYGRAGAPLAGVAISIPGPVDPDTQRPSSPPIMPGWDGFPIAEHLRDALGVPVLVANDADAAALGEQRTHHPAARSLFYLKVSSGIGGGIVVGGRLYQGSDGGAGDIGHVDIGGHDEALCPCGAYGHLAAVASGGAVARSLTALGKRAMSATDVGRYLADGDTDALRLIREAGRSIGAVLATAVTLLNPSDVVVGGMLASAPLLTGIRETLYPRALPRATRHLTLSQSRTGAEASVVGLAALMVDREFSPAAVDAAVSRP